MFHLVIVFPRYALTAVGFFLAATVYFCLGQISEQKHPSPSARSSTYFTVRELAERQIQSKADHIVTEGTMPASHIVSVTSFT
jgi:hypothetical protein